MTHAKNKVDWCLRKADKEGKHRGLRKIKPDVNLAREHISKAEHYLKATEHLKIGNFTDISASTLFYAMYHSLLSICVKFGYESRNQECTFAVIYDLIEEKKIDLDISLLNKISGLNVDDNKENTTLEIREKYQYGTAVTLNENIYNELFELAKEVISKAKEIIEE